VIAARSASTARAALVLLPAALLALHAIDSSDVWFHLATGRLVLEGGGLPSADPFAAYPPGTRWMVHDWLGGVGLYALYALGRAPALVLGCAAAFVAALACLLAGQMQTPQRRAREWAVLAATFLAYERFFVRPELVSILMTALFARVASAGGPTRRATTAALIAAQVLWANTHAAFVLGPVIFLLVPAGCWLDRFLTRDPTRAPARQQFLLPVGLAAACLVTPYGAGLLQHAWRALRAAQSDAVRFGIVEWQPTFGNDWLADPVRLVFAASLAFIALCMWRRRRALDGFGILLVLAMSVLAGSARRHLPLFAVSALPIAADWWSAAARQPDAARRTRLFGRVAALAAPVVALFLAADVARGAFYARFGPPRQLGLGISQQDHCIAAGEFVERHALPGPLFNNVAAGSYLVWRLHGEPRVFVDGRLLDADHFTAYRRLLNDPAAFDARDFRLVVFALQPHPPVQLFRHLANSPRWRLGFMDGEGAVFVHTDVLHERPTIAPWNLAAALPTADASGDCDINDARARGRVLVQLGFAAAAAADLERALAACPDRWDIGLELATALNVAGRSDEARPLVERALERDPGSSTAWVEWGWLLGASGDVAGARAAWERARTMHPVDPRAARLLAAVPR